VNAPRFEMWRIKGSYSSGVRDAYNRAKSARAEIIDAATLVELKLNDFLCLKLAGTDKHRSELVKNCVLTAEFCTLFQKWRILRAVLTVSGVEEPGQKEQVTRLKNLIAMRNAFAHGELVVDEQSLTATLYYREGERKALVIDPTTISSILSEAMTSFHWISTLLQKEGDGASEL